LPLESALDTLLPDDDFCPLVSVPFSSLDFMLISLKKDAEAMRPLLG